MKVEKMVVIGGGPAGLTAAIYGARANLRPLVFEGTMPGGQLMETTKVENFPGFPDGIFGPQLMARMKEQTERLGTRFIADEVSEALLKPKEHVLRYGKNELTALTVIIATGATARKLGIKGEAELGGRGVSYCATCDGFFFKEKSVIVIGGGDSAMEEAIYLAALCGKVTVIHRRDKFRACPALVDRAGALKNMEFLYDHVPVAFVPTEEDVLRGVQVRNVKTGEERLLEVDGAFVAIGHDPKSTLFKGQLDMDENGYLITEKGGTRTSMEGVYAAGDVQDNNYQQAVTAAGTGCMAAKDAIRYLESI